VVSESKWRALRARMERLGIRECDIEEQFVRSGGRGGQNVNKTATCVVLLHRPSGIRVKCQIARTQADNRFFARRILCERIEAGTEEARQEAALERHRVRSRARKRSMRTKERMLDARRRRAHVKAMRKIPDWEFT
jgi:protein subunit release factor B